MRHTLLVLGLCFSRPGCGDSLVGGLWLALHALSALRVACPSVLPWGSVVASLLLGGPVSPLLKFALLYVVLFMFVVYSLVVAPALDLCSQLRWCLW